MFSALNFSDPFTAWKSTLEIFCASISIKFAATNLSCSNLLFASLIISIISLFNSAGSFLFAAKVSEADDVAAALVRTETLSNAGKFFNDIPARAAAAPL